jgi:hypothetical protein
MLAIHHYAIRLSQPRAGRFVNGELINCRHGYARRGKTDARHVEDRAALRTRLRRPSRSGEAAKLRQETKEWLRERELAECAPSIVPERTPEPDKAR